MSKKYIIAIIIIVVVAILAGVSWYFLSTQKKSLAGTWDSSVKGKGMQGSGEIITANANTKINVTGDVNLVIEKVENNIASGTISYNNVCYTLVISMPGKSDISEPSKCISISSKQIEAKITDNTISSGGNSDDNDNVSLLGNYTNNTISGTFTKTISVGKFDEKISGTFNLARAKD